MTRGQKPNLSFTDADVASVIGKHLLVGVTHRDKQDQVISFEQFHGTVRRVSLHEGLVLSEHGTGKERFLPPDLKRFEKAEPGQYRLRSTGEVVNDPDFTVMWTIYPKASVS